MFLRNNKQKFSIRKLSAGAASVLVATSVLGGTTVKANSEVSRTATPRLSRDLKNRLSDIAISRDASSAQKVRNLLKGASVGDLQALLRGLDSARAAYGRDDYYNLLMHLSSMLNDKPDGDRRQLSLASLLVDELKSGLLMEIGMQNFLRLNLQLLNLNKKCLEKEIPNFEI